MTQDADVMRLLDIVGKNKGNTFTPFLPPTPVIIGYKGCLKVTNENGLKRALQADYIGISAFWQNWQMVTFNHGVRSSTLRWLTTRKPYSE